MAHFQTAQRGHPVGKTAAALLLPVVTVSTLNSLGASRPEDCFSVWGLAFKLKEDALVKHIYFSRTF